MRKLTLLLCAGGCLTGLVWADQKPTKVVDLREAAESTMSDFSDAPELRLKDAVIEVDVKSNAKEQIKVGDSDDSLVIFDRRSYVNSARSRGTRILSAAWNKIRASHPDAATIYATSYSRLNGTTIHWPNPGYDFRACEPNTLAFVFIGDQTNMYLCSQSFQYPEKSMAQIFIHESAHLQLIGDECQATYLEVGVMNWSGEGIAFRNGYWSQCFK